MARIIWTKPALSDLDEIAEYIAFDKPSASRKLVQKIFSVVERLEIFPESGRVPPELENSDYREVIVSPCRIFYHFDQGEEGSVYILHVMRGERQLRKFVLERDFSV